MGDNSGIQWTDATWNPMTGCTKVSPECANCYIDTTPPFRMRGRKFVKGHIPIEIHEDRLDQPIRWTRPRMIFVNSLSDLFHEHIPDAFIDRVFTTIMKAPQHRFQILTKRHLRMQAYMKARREMIALALGKDDILYPPTNAILGVSAGNQTMIRTRLPALLDTLAHQRFISIEPLLGDINIGPYLTCGGIHWVIVGGESVPRGKQARMCRLDVIRKIVADCRAAGVPVFVKQLGANAVERVMYGPATFEADQPVHFDRLRLRHSKGGDWNEWPEDLRVREFPAEWGIAP